ncbi:TIGR03943 family putative permease subunit [Bacillus sp. Marseille-Q1617]|uniref:TIGR03943 family putative permease subunit n=1 Tax=Bacillus sp. Marseille-Q1617 TaxID=2736887 RepID=UPI00158DD176|nr:TIGR03943 family protein [Bacillus sp. Marseille-Q1617]
MKSSEQFHTYIRGIILIGYALLVLKLFLTFNLQNFVAPKMHIYMYFSLGVFLVLGVIQIIRGTSSKGKAHHCDCEGHELPKGFLRSTIVYSLFVFPIVLGFLLPDNLLDSSVAAKRGVKVGNSLFTTPPNSGEEQPDASQVEEKEPKGHTVEPTLGSYEEFPVEKDFDKLKELLGKQEKIIVRDEQYIQTLSVVDENLDQYAGKEIQLTGFVYKDEGFAQDEIVVSRFTVTCCVADASVYGILARDEELGKLEPDTWINISGIIGKTDFNGSQMPVIKNPVFEKIDPPDNPYVEEFFIKIE